MKHRVAFMLAATAMVAAGLVNALQSRGQPQSEARTPLAFEVASVKPSQPGGRGGGIRPLPGGQRYVATNVPLRLMIKLMYKITDSQIVGGPDWLNTELYDIQAKAEHPSNIDQLHEMFQTLLADRFKLQFHRETRTLPIYSLTVDKMGSKLKLSESTEAFEIPIKPVGRGKVTGLRVPMSYFGWFLSQQLNRPVVDGTGLDQYYDFTLEWTPEPGGPGGALPTPGSGEREGPPGVDGPTIFTALREQLGLKLGSQKGPVEVFVIDRAERPSEN